MHRECQWGGSALRSLLSLRKLVLVRVAMCCGVLRCGAVWCSVVQFAAVLLQLALRKPSQPKKDGVAVCCSALQCGAACCSVVQCVAVCCSVPCRSLLSPRNLVVVRGMTHSFVA